MLSRTTTDRAASLETVELMGVTAAVCLHIRLSCRTHRGVTVQQQYWSHVLTLLAVGVTILIKGDTFNSSGLRPWQ